MYRDSLIQILVTTEEKEKFKAYAEKAGVNMSGLIRMAIHQYLDGGHNFLMQSKKSEKPKTFHDITPNQNLSDD